MIKPITTFGNHVILLVIHTTKVALLITLVVLFTLPAYAREDLLTDMETKALVLNKQGQYSEAVNTAKESLKVAEEAFGSDHPRLAKSMSILGLIYFSQGKYSDAESIYMQALKIDEKAFGNDHPDVATDLDNLALLLRPGQTYRVYTSVQANTGDQEKAFGLNKLIVITSRNRLGSLYYSQGMYEEAIPLFKRTLAIQEKTPETDQDSVVATLNILALTYHAQGKYTEAEPLLKTALAISEKTHGLFHPEYATSLNNLAGIYKALGKYARSLQFYKQALVIRERTWDRIIPM